MPSTMNAPTAALAPAAAPAALAPAASTAAPAPSVPTTAVATNGTPPTAVGPPAAPAPVANDPQPGALDDSQARWLPQTDLGNAERLVGRFGPNLHYCHSEKCWYAWDTTRWVADQTGQAERYAKKTARLIQDEAELADDEDAKKLREFGRQTESAHRLGAMLRTAQSEPGIPVTPGQFDTDGWVLNVANGTLDLTGGQLRGHEREDLLTKRTDIDYDPAATCPRWEQFLKEVLPDDADVHPYVHKLFGYLLTGDVSDHSVVMLLGEGANGKTTFIEVLRALVGDYGKTTDPDLLLAAHGGRNTAGQAELRGVRVAVSSEVSSGATFDGTTLKRLAGGDTITARRLYQNFSSFEPTHKLVLAVNKMPRLDERDYAMYRRLRPVPFPNKFAGAARDRGLKDTLMAELPGILAWAVRGFRMWQQDNHLTPPDVMMDQVEEVKAANDPLAEFLEDCCVLEKEAVVTGGELYGAYKDWADENGEKALSNKEFARLLKERGLNKRKQGKGGCNKWFGIGLQPPSYKPF